MASIKILFYLISEHFFTGEREKNNNKKKKTFLEKQINQEKKKANPLEHMFHRFLTREHKVFQHTSEKSPVFTSHSTLPVTSTALSPTGSGAVPPRYMEEMRHTPQNTSSPPQAPSTLPHSSPSKAGRRLQSSMLPFSTGLLLAMRSTVAPKSTVTPIQSHPKGLAARASIAWARSKHKQPTSPPQSKAGAARCSLVI